jgi:excisionase family DNA binding protein
MPDTLPRYVSVADAAAMLSISEERVRDLIHAGGLPAVDISAQRGGKPRYRIAVEALNAWLAGRSTVPPPRPQRRPRAATYRRRYY